MCLLNKEEKVPKAGCWLVLSACLELRWASIYLAEKSCLTGGSSSCTGSWRGTEEPHSCYTWQRLMCLSAGRGLGMRCDPYKVPPVVPGLTQFPFCSEQWRRGEVWRGSLCPFLLNSQGMFKGFVESWSGNNRDLPTALMSFMHSRLLWDVSSANLCIDTMGSGSEIRGARV